MLKHFHFKRLVFILRNTVQLRSINFSLNVNAVSKTHNIKVKTSLRAVAAKEIAEGTWTGSARTLEGLGLEVLAG